MCCVGQRQGYQGEPATRHIREEVSPFRFSFESFDKGGLISSLSLLFVSSWSRFIEEFVGRGVSFNLGSEHTFVLFWIWQYVGVYEWKYALHYVNV